ncbi:MAG: DUF4149 domain-containing protein [Chloroflexi bacterium]|nr:DUF4149 domain-containing protein [Chloroflexota bacterium]
MNWYVIGVYIHILAAVIWIGGMLFLGLVVVPLVQALQPPGTGARVVRAVGRRFRPVAWVCIGVLLVTGTANLDHWGYSPLDLFSRNLLDTQFGRVLAVKLGIVLTIVVLSTFHDFVLGPRVARLMEASAAAGNPGAAPSEAARLRRRLSLLARLNVLLALAVLALAVMLVRGLPW